MSLPTWLLLLSGLLAVAVLLGVLARRAHIPLTVVLALVGFLAGWLGDIESPISAERFEEVLVFVFLPVLVFEAAFSLSTRAFFETSFRSSSWRFPPWSSRQYASGSHSTVSSIHR